MVWMIMPSRRDIRGFLANLADLFGLDPNPACRCRTSDYFMGAASRTEMDIPRAINRSIAVGVWDGFIMGSQLVTDGKWHHVAAVLDDDGSPDVSKIVCMWMASWKPYDRQQSPVSIRRMLRMFIWVCCRKATCGYTLKVY
jgi:hypothetical protein